MYDFLCLIYFTMDDTLQGIHIVPNGKILLFFMAL